MSYLRSSDRDIYDAIVCETERQEYKLELIASENMVSEAVLEAAGSVLTNKYAEGYPGKRYYGGCEYVDIVENIAIKRAKALFGCEHVNVQPHSGSQANMAVYMSMLKPGDTVLGMNLSHGGHLTHGSPVNFSGKLYNVVFYGVRRDNQRIDYDQVLSLTREYKPRMIVVGASAYSRIIDFKHFRTIADECGAYLMVDMAHIAGLVAVGLHPSPLPHSDFVTTTTHKTLRGPRGGMIMCKSEYARQIDKMIFPGIQGGPLMHVIAAKAVAFGEAMKEGFREYQERVISNAAVLSSELASRGYDIVAGGTDTHLMLVDLTARDVTGKDAEDALVKAGITVNKNTVPFETRSPFVTSGVRLGTPAVTTRGMKEAQMSIIASMIDEAVDARSNESALASIKTKVQRLCRDFPFYSRRLSGSEV